MASSKPTIEQEIERYLRTGGSDLMYKAWPGTFSERRRSAHRELRGLLDAHVIKLAGGRSLRARVPEDTTPLTRRKVEPMIRGLFPEAERRAVIGAIENSVVFLTPLDKAYLLRDAYWDKTAWDLGNLYLASLGAELLGKDTPESVGLVEGPICYVSIAYFREKKPFTDFIVHEAAHFFHNWKRRTIGLPETRGREWLLPIEYCMRETFARACETYSRIVERSDSAERRRLLAKKFASKNHAEIADIVSNAVAVRNGWKAILARCSSPRRRLSGSKALSR